MPSPAACKAMFLKEHNQGKEAHMNKKFVCLHKFSHAMNKRLWKKEVAGTGLRCWGKVVKAQAYLRQDV
jgi:hypothetical protein